MRFVRTFLLVAFLIGACSPDQARDLGLRERDPITIPNLTGLDRTYAEQLIDNLDLEIVIERVDPEDLDETADVPVGRFPGDTVLAQAPASDTQVPAGSTITLFVPHERELRPGEEPFKLLTHCGLSIPFKFERQLWLPVDRRLQGPEAPEGFSSKGFFDTGTLRRIDRETLIYTSSTGIEVRYEPTDKEPKGCE